MRRSLSIIFMGTSGFAVPILHAVFDHYQVLAVVTQPDRPRGRGRSLSISKVKESALRLAVPLLQPERARDRSFIDQIKRLKPRLIVVAAYGQILSEALLKIPEMGCINIHASLLPRHRGAAPIARTIADGESRTGVTTILMDEGMDTGPILLSREVPIGQKETAPSLERRLAEVGTEVIIETIRGLEEGTIRPAPQDDSRATYAPALKKEDGWIDWSQPSEVLHRRIRALNPWPGTFTRMGGKTLKIFSAEVDETPQSQDPGCVVNVGGGVIRVATGKDHLILKEIQLEGKRRLPVRDFLLGHPVKPGTILGADESGAKCRSSLAARTESDC
jgi:methionyl-tRNA formyltransferase